MLFYLILMKDLKELLVKRFIQVNIIFINDSYFFIATNMALNDSFSRVLLERMV